LEVFASPVSNIRLVYILVKRVAVDVAQIALILKLDFVNCVAVLKNLTFFDFVGFYI